MDISRYASAPTKSEDLIEINPNTYAATHWPRTTGADVIAIAALVDSAVRANGTLGILRRWRATLADLQRAALPAPRDTYPQNRSFWASIESVAVFLDDVAVAPPAPAIWDALVDQLGTVVELRNVGPSEDGPLAHFDGIKTYDDLLDCAEEVPRREARLRHARAATGFGGATTRSRARPTRTCSSSRRTGPPTHEHEARDGLRRHRRDVARRARRRRQDREARQARRGLRKEQRVLASSWKVAVQVAVSDEAPTKWDMVVSSVKDSVTHLPENLGAAASKGADLLASAAHAVGKVVNEAGKGLFAGLGTPVLIGAGCLACTWSRADMTTRTRTPDVRALPWLVGRRCRGVRVNAQPRDKGAARLDADRVDRLADRARDSPTAPAFAGPLRSLGVAGAELAGPRAGDLGRLRLAASGRASATGRRRHVRAATRATRFAPERRTARRTT